MSVRAVARWVLLGLPSAVAGECSFCNVHAFLSFVSSVAITSLSQSLNIAVRWKLFDLASGSTFYSWTLQAFESLLKIATGIQTCKQTTSNPTKARCRDEKLDGPDVSVTASRNFNPRGPRRPHPGAQFNCSIENSNDFSIEYC